MALDPVYVPEVDPGGVPLAVDSVDGVPELDPALKHEEDPCGGPEESEPVDERPENP